MNLEHFSEEELSRRYELQKGVIQTLDSQVRRLQDEVFNGYERAKMWEDRFVQLALSLGKEFDAEKDSPTA